MITETKEQAEIAELREKIAHAEASLRLMQSSLRDKVKAWNEQHKEASQIFPDPETSAKLTQLQMLLRMSDKWISNNMFSATADRMGRERVYNDNVRHQIAKLQSTAFTTIS
jgi:hypothetical protein